MRIRLLAALSLFGALVVGTTVVPNATAAAAEPVVITAGSHPAPCNDSGRNLSLNRDQIIKRAKSWLNVVPYSQSHCWTNQYGDYRQDCSGYVSMAWGLSFSRWTGNLDEIADTISQMDLKAGDALLRHDGSVQHTAIFVRWVGAVGGDAVVYEEYTTGTNASQRVWDSSKVDSFRAIRYKNVVDEDHWHDWNSDGQGDIMARDGDGDLYLYPGSGAPRVKVSDGWGKYNVIDFVGDWNGDGRADMVARDGAGDLWLYPGGGKPRVRISGGWGTYNLIAGVGDWNNDNRGDLVARDGDGVLWLYSGTGTPRQRISGGWGTYNLIEGAGDWNDDGSNDIVARDGDGDLYLYPGGGSPRVKISDGWGKYNVIAGVGDWNDDGKDDMVARDGDGVLWLYAGSSGGPRMRISGGWGTYNLLA